jgi:hypothetical protein
MAPAPSLHGRYPLPRYYEPVRLPTAADGTVMSSHTASGPSLGPCNVGPPRFLDRSVPTRRPLTPRRARRVLAPVASASVAGFITFGSLATLDEVHEADSGSLALRLAGSLPEASPARSLRPSPARSLRPTLGSLPAERAIRRITSFQMTRSARLRLAHRMTEWSSSGAATHCTNVVVVVLAVAVHVAIDEIHAPRACRGAGGSSRRPVGRRHRAATGRNTASSCAAGVEHWVDTG